METSQQVNIKKKVEQKYCAHCGDVCPNSNVHIGEKFFCCNGCKLVYELLEANDLCNYYSFEETPGNSPKEAGYATKFQYLEDQDVKQKLIDFTDGNTSTASFFIPGMHCSSCVWLLESLYRLSPLVISSQVDFLKKQLSVTFKETPTSLRELVELLASIGYEPQINLDSLHEQVDQDSNKELYIKIGVAGFCFANIMLLSFPNYLAGGSAVEPQLQKFFSALTILLSLPVFFYSAQGYFHSALNGWKQRYVNMDVPISIGILTLFFRSLYEILSSGAHGYMDSFAALVFLLLLGKLFEKKTFDTLSFERDYKSYFPVSVTIKKKNGETTIPLQKLHLGDRMVIRNHELVPADAVMINGNALIDYSFVTGESAPVKKISGDIVFAGGRQVGGAIELDVIKEVNQSYLTQLWNDDAFIKSHQSKVTTLANSISKYFTLVVIMLATLAAFFWLRTNISLALTAFTSVLIVACPCALALSTPFTLGNTLRIFGRQKFYLKNTAVIEALSKINAVVFDKTGTITRAQSSKIEFSPAPDSAAELSAQEAAIIYSLVRQSNHPLSQQIAFQLNQPKTSAVHNFKEHPGEGIEADVQGTKVKLGSYSFIYGRPAGNVREDATRVYVVLNGKSRGFFRIANIYRPELGRTIENLSQKFDVKLLTGDGENEKQNLLQFFKNEKNLFFRQMPVDKLNFIRNLQKLGKRVLMVGDGLNDAGALKQSDVGVSVSEDVNTFSPASDAILDAGHFQKLTDFIDFSRTSMKIIVASFAISFLYNSIGLGFAMSGTLSPLIAAVLMPLSSISVILFTTGTTTFFAKRKGIL